MSPLIAKTLQKFGNDYVNPNKGAIIKSRIKKAFINKRILDNPMNDVILAKACSFPPAFLRKATGMDQIQAKFLRDGAEVLDIPLRNIINLSIKLSTLPEECKIAKLKPIFKISTRTDPKTTDLFHFCR